MCGSKNRTLATLVTPPAAAAGMPSATAATSPRKTSLAQILPCRQTPLLKFSRYRGLRYSAYLRGTRLTCAARGRFGLRGYRVRKTGSGSGLFRSVVENPRHILAIRGRSKALSGLTRRAGQRRRERKFIRIINIVGGREGLCIL